MIDREIRKYMIRHTLTVVNEICEELQRAFGTLEKVVWKWGVAQSLPASKWEF